MPDYPLSHDEVLDKLCGTCYRKGAALKLRGISANALAAIQKYHWAGYNVDSGEYPRKVCQSCNSILLHIAKAGGLEASKRKLPPPRYDTMQSNRITRSSPECQCYWCSVWRLNGGPYSAHVAAVRANPGRPPIKEASPPPEAVLRCDRCQGEVGKGVPHKCTVTTMENNTLELIEAMPSTSKQRITAKLLDKLREEQGADPTRPGTLMLATRGSKFKTVTIGKVRPKRKFTHQDILRLRVGLGLSADRTLYLAAGMRSVMGRDCIVPGLQPFMVLVNQRLREHFHSKTKDIMTKVKKQISFGQTPAVFSKDVEELVKIMIELRAIDPEDSDIQFGFDDGQGFLKLMMMVLSKPELEHKDHQKRAKYADGICAKTFKNTSVKKVIIVGVMKSQENYHNVKGMLEEVDINGVDSTFSPDMKMGHIYQGRQGGSCKRNCNWCNGHAPWDGDCMGILLRIGDLFREYNR